MDEIRIAISAVLSMMLAFFAPIQNVMVAFAIIFAVDFLCGLVADVVNGGEWNTRKALRFLDYAFLVFGTAAFVFGIGHLLGEHKGALQCVSGLAYLTLYSFGTNILRNILRIVRKGSPAYMIFSFLYWLFTLKFVTLIPYFKEWQAAVNNNRDMEEVEEIKSTEL